MKTVQELDCINIRNETISIVELHRWVKRFNVDVSNDYITPELSIKIIISILMRIPLPRFVAKEDMDCNMVIVQNADVLNTILQFAGTKESFPLNDKSLPVELQGKTFYDLSAKLQNRIDDAILNIHIIDAKTEESLVIDYLF